MITNPPDSSSKSSNPEDGFPLTPARQELLSWLHEHAPLLEELFRGSLELLYGRRAVPGRFHFVAHAAREMANRMPEALSEVRVKGRLDYKSRLDVIADHWKREGLNLEGSLPSSDAQVPLPRPLYRRVAKLVRDHVTTRSKPEEAAIRMYMATSSENKEFIASVKPVVTRWLKTADYFRQRAHVPGIKESNIREEEFQRHFELFEDALGALVRGFYPTLKEINDILEDANTPEG